jgi:hypothetical protein
MARDHAVHHLQHRRDQFGLGGKLANRSGIGSVSAHLRTGTSGMTCCNPAAPCPKPNPAPTASSLRGASRQ